MAPPLRTQNLFPALLLGPKEAQAYFKWAYQLVHDAQEQLKGHHTNASTAPAAAPAPAAGTMHTERLAAGAGVTDWHADIVVHRDAAYLASRAAALRTARIENLTVPHAVGGSTGGGEASPRTAAANAPRPPLEVLLCPRPWLGHFLKAAANGTTLPPLKKMGEVRAWVPLMRALYELGCVVGVSTSERCEWWRGFAAGHEADAGRERLVLIEELSRAFLQDHGNASCRSVIPRVVATANEKAAFVPPEKTLTPFRESRGWPMGVQASCPHRGSPYPPRKRWFAMLWGKARQSVENMALFADLAQVAGVIPILATCAEDCDAVDVLRVPNLRLVPREAFNELMASALMMIGIKAARAGASVAEALACGTYVVAKPEHVPREFHAHPLVRIVTRPLQAAAAVRRILREHGLIKGRSILRQRQPPLHRIPLLASEAAALRSLKADAQAATNASETARLRAKAHNQEYVVLPSAWCRVGDELSSSPATTNCTPPAPWTFRSWLPPRYTAKGHVEWIRRTFGVDRQCRVVNRRSPLANILRAPWGDVCGR